MLAWNNFFRFIVFVAIVALLFASLPASNLWWREAVNSGHTLLFIFLSFVIYHYIKGTVHVAVNTWLIYLYVLLTGMVLGFAIEILQALVQRGASQGDIYGNFYGIVTGICLIALLELKNRRLQRLHAAFLTFTATGFLLLGLMPLLQLSWHYIERNNAFPVIADFDESWLSSFVHYNDAEIVKNSASNNNLHQLWLYQGDYPGISIIEPVPDWSGYRNLRLNIYSMHDHSRKLVLRIHDDSHNQNHSDRFNEELPVRPGLNTFAIPLSSIQQGPVERELDLTHIAGVILFSTGLDEPLQFSLGNIFLE